MEESISTLIFRVSATFIFIAALGMFITLFYKSQYTSKLVIDGLCDPVAISDRYSNGEENYAKGSDIIASIRNELDTDITVDGASISKDVDIYSYNYNEIDASARYKISYTIDINGKVTRVNYVKI